jgi:hypothetical protein
VFYLAASKVRDAGVVLARGCAEIDVGVGSSVCKRFVQGIRARRAAALVIQRFVADMLPPLVERRLLRTELKN